MAKSNYAAWHVNSKDFSDDWSDVEKLQFFVRYAVLAPSGHNTQPWRFVAKKDTLALNVDFSRHLPYSGLKANEPYVSLGACLGVFRLAAKGFGYDVKVSYVFKDSHIANITLGGKTVADTDLLEAIVNRVSNRSLYDKKPLPAKTLEAIAVPTSKNVVAKVLSSRDDINYIAEETTKSTLKIMSDKEFRLELSKWVRNNLTKQHDGMPGFVQEIPTPPSMLARHMIKHVNISKDQAKKDSKRVLNSANLILVIAKDGKKETLVEAGASYAQICVLAQKHGIATTGIGAAVIDTDTTDEIVKKYKLSGKPVGIIRLGKASKGARHAPRWTYEHVSK